MKCILTVSLVGISSSDKQGGFSQRRSKRPQKAHKGLKMHKKRSEVGKTGN